MNSHSDLVKIEICEEYHRDEWTYSDIEILHRVETKSILEDLTRRNKRLTLEKRRKKHETDKTQSVRV